MITLLVTFAFFILSIAAHVQFCRWRKRESNLWFYVFFAGAALAGNFMSLKFLLNGPAKDLPEFWSLPLFLSSLTLFIMLIPMYMIIYFGSEVESPTKKICFLLDSSGGMTKEELLKQITDEGFVVPRMDDLVRTGFVEHKEGKYFLLFPSRASARLLAVFQWIFGRGKGG